MSYGRLLEYESESFVFARLPTRFFIQNNIDQLVVILLPFSSGQV